MASISTAANGRRTIQFVAGDRKRKSVRLGKVSMKIAQEVRTKVESLNAAIMSQTSVDNETAKWVGGIDDMLHGKLVAVGLCEPRELTASDPQSTKSISEFAAKYLEMRSDLKPSTMRHLREARDKLEGFFGGDRAMASVTKLDAEAYRLHLGKSLGENTTRRMVSRARQFFAAALRGRLIDENPFAHLTGLAVRAVKERQAFIKREQIAKFMEAAPSAEWRAIIALARYGGIRVPSELFPLRWGDIDWANNRLTITSPKTEHCGQPTRVVPLFPELRSWLEEAFDAAEPGSEFVVSKHRAASENMRQGLLRIIRRAGLQA
jgi:integrase